MITLGLGGGFRPGQLTFFDNASAGEATVETDAGGETVFDGNSTAANATFTTVGGVLIFSITSTAADSVVTCSEGGGASFDSFATAGNGRFTSNGATDSGKPGTFVNFLSNTTAGDATFIINGGTVRDASGGVMAFFQDATAGSAKVRANGGAAGGAGGSIQFNDKSDGGLARLTLSGNGNLDIGNHGTGLTTVGSIQGDGLVFLGGRALAVGSNNRSTTFSGVIQDGGISQGTGGSLTKIGTATLKLSGANTYTGGTTVSEGALTIGNTTGSGTGSGPVQVNSGTLTGPGIIAGAVTIGSGSGTGALLAPRRGEAQPTALTVQASLTYKADATYLCRLSTQRAKSDEVIANGVAIESGAQFTLQVAGRKRLPAGTTFTLISNTSANPIAGAFANLPDGSTLSAGPNTLQVSYTGGDGNDLTLTVLP
ncbi:MAG: autotransporter-associated beta strand repeat-containing protein [Chthoniobacterales bacterium]|nr:autotransporter-associated beta strand repeat-containing protein [Chthoniobacterales bacterium]